MKRWSTKQRRDFLSNACLLILIFTVLGLTACGSSGGSGGERGDTGRTLLSAPTAAPAAAVKTLDGVTIPFDNDDFEEELDKFRNRPQGFDVGFFPWHIDYLWWILKSQRDMALDEPITNTLHIGSHNAGNARRYNARRIGLVGPNQTFTIPEVLSVGARYVELDAFIWEEAQKVGGEKGDYIVVGHDDIRHSDWTRFAVMLHNVGEWLHRAENRNEIVIIDVEDNIEKFCNFVWKQPDNSGTLKNMSRFDLCGWRPSEDSGSVDLMVAVPRLAEANVDFRPLFLHWLGVTGPFNPGIFTPDDLVEREGVWPSRRELIDMGKRVVVLSDTARRLNGDPATTNDDIAFNFRGEEAPATQVTVSAYSQAKADSFRLKENENAERFLILQGDSQGSQLSIQSGFLNCIIFQRKDMSLEDTGQPRLTFGHVRLAVENNLNVLKMDSILGHNFHAPHYEVKTFVKTWNGLSGAEEFFGDLFGQDTKKLCGYDFDDHIEAEMWALPIIGNSYSRFRETAWSWEIKDPASIRGAFTDLFKGDSTGASLLDRNTREWVGAVGQYQGSFSGLEFVDLNGSTFRHPALWSGDIANALANGRDVAFQRPSPDSHWNSAAPDAAEYAFALRTISRFDKIRGNETVTPDMNDPSTMERTDGPGGAYLWRRSILRDTWDKSDKGIFYPSGVLVDEIRQLNLETGTRWFFAGPINGFQNATLRDAPTPGDPEPVWIKVDDLDLDGHWEVGTEPPPLIRVYDEGEDKYYFTPTMPPEATDWWQAEAHCDQLSIDRFMGFDRWRQANGSRAFRFIGLAENGTYWTRHRHGNKVKGTVAILPDMEKETKLKEEQAIPLCVAELEAEHEFPFIPPGIEKHPETAHPPLSQGELSLSSESPKELG